MALLAWVLIGVAIVLYLRRPLPETDPAVTAAASARGGLDRQDPAGGREIPFAAGLLRFVQTPWVGDLDGMLERRLIRVLIVPSAARADRCRSVTRMRSSPDPQDTAIDALRLSPHMATYLRSTIW
ncbi:MAG: hypothetical protein WBM40_15620 [Thiohalocapsa sp.]